MKSQSEVTPGRAEHKYISRASHKIKSPIMDRKMVNQFTGEFNNRFCVSHGDGCGERSHRATSRNLPTKRAASAMMMGRSTEKLDQPTKPRTAKEPGYNGGSDNLTTARSYQKLTNTDMSSHPGMITARVQSGHAMTQRMRSPPRTYRHMQSAIPRKVGVHTNLREFQLSQSRN